jgi:hypothetical protein
VGGGIRGASTRPVTGIRNIARAARMSSFSRSEGQARRSPSTSSRFLAANSTLGSFGSYWQRSGEIFSRRCPVRVKSGSRTPPAPCPLHPRKRTSESRAVTSALGQKQKSVIAQTRSTFRSELFGSSRLCGRPKRSSISEVYSCASLS